MHWITFLVALYVTSGTCPTCSSQFLTCRVPWNGQKMELTRRVCVWACVVGQGVDGDWEEETSYRTRRLPTTTTTRTMGPRRTIRTTTMHSHTLDVVCHTGADCGKSECCQELDAALYLHGRNIADVKPFVRSFPGICVPMGRIAYDCHPHVPYAWNKPEGLVQLCPCRTGLICGRTHLRDKFGDKGMCSSG